MLFVQALNAVGRGAAHDTESVVFMTTIAPLLLADFNVRENVCNNSKNVKCGGQAVKKNAICISHGF